MSIPYSRKDDQYKRWDCTNFLNVDEFWSQFPEVTNGPRVVQVPPAKEEQEVP